MSIDGISCTEQIRVLYDPYKGKSDLWCHRTRVMDAEPFWKGLEIPRLQQGLDSTATLITSPTVQVDPEIDLSLYTTILDSEDPTNNARVFIVAPTTVNEYLKPLETAARFQNKGLLPGNFVLAHLKLLPPATLTRNPLFDPRYF